MERTLIKADPGFTAIGVDQEYRLEKCWRYAVLMWEMRENGLIVPRTLNPWHDHSVSLYVIEQPDGNVYSYTPSGTVGWAARSLKEWLQEAQLRAASPSDLHQA